ncbi:hypothetical protein BRAO375_1990006 [Bradyrhizobium sp. ORS 375]|uniref:DNA sulfur modification protein DndB n=1 Tax=Bradyrhizobium sp. (strain ORS 375) TaxID=566679 RepID=UPI000240AD22|nr:DNA sulfur modification protein DndB [Bradyrhizobium sp. ORS 375]CCD92334.1 hypothetical protein BRAO375_1990006 [Bradyrhizobium sp. ORS 375]
MKSTSSVAGFLDKPKTGARGTLYRGRFVCEHVQWTGSSSDLLGTFTITIEELADAAESRLLWTDQAVQRGIQPHIDPAPPRELCLADGYPDPKKYVFDASNADDITEKLLNGEKLFLSPLIWNLRPGTFEAYWDEEETALYIYSGNIYLPDSHHRHQAILKAVRTWRSAKKDYPKFLGDREFKIELYFLTKEDEGNYFFDKNQRPKPTAKSKAYDLTTQDDLSLLAKLVIERSKNLSGNVNRVTDRLIASNFQVITLSTLREMMNSFASTDSLDESELDGLATVAAEFYDLLVTVRPELGILAQPDRRKVRENLVVDSAVMMHGFAALMKDFNNDLAEMGTIKARREWAKKVKCFSAERQYRFRQWKGDLFAKANPLWRAVGVVKHGRDSRRLTVLNTGAARGECGRVLRQLVAAPQTTSDLSFLAQR